MKKFNFIQIGAFLCALSVILGAFGAHGLRGQIEPYLFDVYQTANQYFFYHSVAIILYGLWRKSMGSVPVKNIPGILFIAGIIIFSGSLYLIVLTEIKTWGMITPLGGLSFIIGWIGFGIQAGKKA